MYRIAVTQALAGKWCQSRPFIPIASRNRNFNLDASKTAIQSILTFYCALTVVNY